MKASGAHNIFSMGPGWLLSVLVYLIWENTAHKQHLDFREGSYICPQILPFSQWYPSDSSAGSESWAAQQRRKRKTLWLIPCNHQAPQSPPWVCGMGTCVSFCQDHQGLGRKPDLVAKSGQHSSDKGKRDPGEVFEIVFFCLKSSLLRAEAEVGWENFFFFFIKRCDWELAIFDDMFLPERSSLLAVPFETLMKSCGAQFSEVSKRNPKVVT